MIKDHRFDFKFYEWEKVPRPPFLRQPFGDQWEEYTWAQVGQMARKLASGLKSMGLRENAHIGLISKIVEMDHLRYGNYMQLCISSFFPHSRRRVGYLLDFGEVD